jgi:hypothetical protein
MPRLSTKTHLLDDAGYAYNYERMMFINRQAKKAFSVEFIDDKPESEIETLIQKPNAEADWLFFTSLPMSEGTKKELKRVLQ